MTNRWTLNNMSDQTGRVAIVTGANSGLGYETSLALAQKNATVIMACRNLKKGEAALRDVRSKAPNASVELMQLDLGDLSSVRSFAEGFQSKYDRLDILINNAGIMAIPRSETKDGFETQFGVNHLGHFALTGLLINLLLKTENSRVVSVSSSANYRGTINFDDLMGEKEYTRWGTYAQSKLANVLFANELQRRLTAIGADTISLSAHPGLAATNLQTTSTSHSGNRVEGLVYSLLGPLLAQSQAQGALPQLFAATDPDANGGDFIGPDFMNMRGYPKKVRAKEDAYDEAIARQLWESSVELTGVSYAELSATAPA
jgi:protochlorophyllide reductase